MPPTGPLVYRQTLWTRVTHWIWAVSLMFLALSGGQIFNAHPALYWGDETGFAYDNTVLSFGDLSTPVFPPWARLPAGQDLATSRVIHFFFGWVFVVAMMIWLLASVLNGHLRRDLLPRRGDLGTLGRDIRDHLRLRLHHTRRYGPLQKLAYGAVLFGLFPLMILTGLAMSPGMNAVFPWLTEIFGGRQSARTLHFAGMLGIGVFFIVHMLMILLAGPLNELRAIITGYYRLDQEDTK